MKLRMVVALALFAVMALPGIAVGTTARVADGTGAWCDGDTDLCWSFPSSNGGNIDGDELNADPGENVSVSGISVCYKANGNGSMYVQNGSGDDGPPCPFASGSGLNNQFHHDEIVEVSYTYCANGAQSALGGPVKEELCDSTGWEWVQDPASGSFVSWVNVWASDNDLSAPEALYACTNGRGNAIVVKELADDGSCKFQLIPT